MRFLSFKEAALSDHSDIQEKMSREQFETYVTDTATFSIIVVVSLLLTVCFAVFLFVVQAAAEARRARREALADKARRLRYRADDTEVRAPSIDERGFHIFLSHVWASGQDQMRVAKQRLLEMIPDLSIFLDVDDLEDISNLQGYIAGASYGAQIRVR